MAVNKVIYGDTTLIDLTSDTVAADKILEGYTAHDKSGAQILGLAKQLGLPVIKRLGYLDNGWYFNTSGVLRFDEYDPDCLLEVFRVIANHKYIWCFGLKDGNRSTVAFTKIDILNYPVDGIQCDKKFAEGDQPPYFVKTILDITEDGYLGAYISNNQQGGKESYLIDITDIDSSTIARLGYKTITESGTYNALDDNLDGFAQVIVDISESGATLTVSYSEDFVGSTFTVTDGTTTLTDVATSSGEIEFTLPNGGTWEISATVDGVTYTEYKNIVLDYSTELVAIPDGKTALPVNDIQKWLKCASITDKNYTTLTQVLLDMDTFIALISDSNACDYMARSTAWATDICADAEAMHLIGKYDYCANALLRNSTWATAIANSTYFESVLNIKVPIMTSNTTPSGVASASTNETNYDPWKAFAGDSIINGWTASSLRNNWIQYKFTLPVVVQRMYYKFNDKDTVTQSNIINLTGSNDGINWTDVKTNISVPHNNTAVYINIENTTAYLYYRITYTTDVITGSNRGVKIQFYGRTDTMIPLVPKMTSNTTPSGEAFASSSYSGNYPYYVFDNNINTFWVAETKTYPCWIGYKFDNVPKVNVCVLEGIPGGPAQVTQTSKIQASVNGTDWVDVSDIFSYISQYVSGTNPQKSIIPLRIDDDYNYFRVYIISNSSSTYYPCIGNLQFCTYVDYTDNVLFRSAAQDDLYYMDNGSPVIIAHTDDYGYAIVDRDLLPEGENLTLYSTVAKDPTNLGNAYSRVIHFSKYLTEVYMLPFNVLYWFGYDSGDIEDAINANGWYFTASGYSMSAPTHNLNNIAMNGGYHIINGIGIKDKVTGTVNILAEGVTLAGDSYGFLSVESSKSVGFTTQTRVTSNSMAKYTISSNNQYIIVESDNNRAMNLYALWLE